MKKTPRRWNSPILVVLVAALMLATLSCRPRLVVRMTTIVYDDGSLTRRFEVSGVKSDGSTPTDPGWLADEAGIWLSDPDAWETVDETPNLLRAEGFFPSVDVLPGTFDLELSKKESRPARIETQLAVDDRVILRRREYVERHGDPFGPAEAAQSLERIVEMAVRALESELSGFFGSAVDVAPAGDVLRSDGRLLLTELLAAGRMQPGVLRTSVRVEQWQTTLRRYDVPPTGIEIDEETFWEDHIPVLWQWLGDRVAAALSTTDRRVDPQELTFWPRGEEWEVQAAEIVGRVWGDEDALFEEAEPHLKALLGYYGNDETPNFLFESRAQLPGTLLQTNGTPDREGIVWIFREGDLGYGERVLKVTTAELLDDQLRTLGARRTFDTASLARLVDLLWKRDTEGALAQVLGTAVSQGSLDLLRDANSIPDAVEDLSTELADLLDPDVPLPESL